jgi:hypothetical protein
MMRGQPMESSDDDPEERPYRRRDRDAADRDVGG